MMRESLSPGDTGHIDDHELLHSFKNAAPAGAEIASTNYVDSVASTLIDADETITVGSGGDHATINDALEALSRRAPSYIKRGRTVEVNLLSGFEMDEQVLVDGVDLGWVTITSADAEVTIDRSALTTDFVAGAFPAFGARRGTLPRIGCVLNMDSSSHADPTACHGLYVRENSRADFTFGAGIKNAGGNGVHALYASQVNCYDADLSGAGVSAIRSRHGSTVVSREADLSGAASDAVMCDHSYVLARGADLTGAGRYAALSRSGGRIVALNATGDKPLVVQLGATIVAQNTSGVTFSQPPNTPTNAGVIWSESPGPSVQFEGTAENSISVAYDASFDPTTSLDIRVLAKTDWSDDANRRQLAWQGYASGGWSFEKRNSATILRVFWNDGANKSSNGAGHGLTSGEWAWVRVVFDLVAEEIRFYVKPVTLELGGADWTMFASHDFEGLTIGATTADIHFGGGATQMVGNVAAAEVLVDGSTVATLDPRQVRSPRWVDDQGNVWKVNGDAWAFAADEQA